MRFSFREFVDRWIVERRPEEERKRFTLGEAIYIAVFVGILVLMAYL